MSNTKEGPGVGEPDRPHFGDPDLLLYGGTGELSPSWYPAGSADDSHYQGRHRAAD